MTTIKSASARIAAPATPIQIKGCRNTSHGDGGGRGQDQLQTMEEEHEEKEFVNKNNKLSLHRVCIDMNNTYRNRR